MKLNVSLEEEKESDYGEIYELVKFAFQGFQAIYDKSK